MNDSLLLRDKKQNNSKLFLPTNGSLKWCILQNLFSSEKFKTNTTIPQNHPCGAFLRDFTEFFVVKIGELKFKQSFYIGSFKRHRSWLGVWNTLFSKEATANNWTMLDWGERVRWKSSVFIGHVRGWQLHPFVQGSHSYAANYPNICQQSSCSLLKSYWFRSTEPSNLTLPSFSFQRPGKISSGHIQEMGALDPKLAFPTNKIPVALVTSCTLPPISSCTEVSSLRSSWIIHAVCGSPRIYLLYRPNNPNELFDDKYLKTR